MLILQNNTNNALFNEKIKQVIQFLLTRFKKKSKIAVALVDIKIMQNFNNNYRNNNRPTNVLSFLSEVPPEIADILGDIIICLEVVKYEAKEQNKTFENHLIHMLVHGFLHLLGYDHIKNDETKIMEKMEIKILQELNIKNPYIKLLK